MLDVTFDGMQEYQEEIRGSVITVKDIGYQSAPKKEDTFKNREQGILIPSLGERCPLLEGI